MNNKFLNWLIMSSEDPTKFSMTINGVLIANIGVIMFFLHTLNLPYTVDQVTLIISAITGFAGGMIALVGLARKLYYAIFSVTTPTV